MLLKTSKMSPTPFNTSARTPTRRYRFETLNVHKYYIHNVNTNPRYIVENPNPQLKVLFMKSRG